jgi:serine/threonine protein kinase/WD40 repeat protein
MLFSISGMNKTDPTPPAHDDADDSAATMADEAFYADPVPPPLPDDGLMPPDFEEQDETLAEDGTPARRRAAAPQDSPTYEDLHDAITERMPRPTGQPAAVRTYVRNFIQQHWGGKDEHRGKRIGDYEIIEELGRGSMGAVFKARQVSLNREVALKMIISGQFASKANRIRFRREAEVSAELRHPNIVGIHDFGDFEGQPYYTMDYVEGRDMAAMVSERPLPWQNAAYYMHKVALAVAYAHDRGIIHRDLKPQNILVDQFDEPRILDFGLARKTDVDSGVTMSSSVIGSPSYMPPEQALGQHNLVGPHSDVYGLGAILYELLTIRPPILAPTIAKTLEMVVNFEPIPPNRANPSIPDDLNTVVLKCLEKAPERRYQTATELAEELGRVLDDRPILAKPIGIFEHAYRWCRRNRAIAALIAISTSLLVGSSIISTSLWVNAELSLKKAEQERRRAETATRSAEEARGLAQKAQAHAEEEMQKAKAALEQVRAAEALAAREGQRAQTAEAGQLAAEERLKKESVRAESAQREAESFRQRAGLTDISQDLLMAMDLWDRKQPAEALGHLARQIRRAPEEWLAPALTLSALTQGTWARPLSAPLPHENQGSVTGLQFVAENQSLLTWTDQGWVNLWDAASATASMREHLGKPILALDAGADGKWAVALVEGGELIRLEPGSSSLPRILAQDAATASPALLARPGQEQVVYTRENGTVAVIVAVTGGQVVEIPLPAGSPARLAFSPDGALLLAARGETVAYYSADNGKSAPQPAFPGPVERVGFSQDGKRYFLQKGGELGLVEVRDTATGKPVGPPVESRFNIADLSLNATGSLLFLRQGSGSIGTYHTGLGQAMGPRFQTDAATPVAALGANGLALVGKEEGLRVYDPLHQGSSTYFPVGERDALRLGLNEAGTRLATVRPDQGVMIYDLTPNEAVPALLPHGGELAEATFSQDGRHVLSLGANGSAQFWRADTGQSLNKLPASEIKVTASCVDPAGKVVVLGLESGRVLVWDAGGTGQTRDLQESGPAISALAFSSDGRLLAAATKGTARYAWFVQAGGERIQLEEPDAGAIPLRIGLAPAPRNTGGMSEGGEMGMGGGGPDGAPRGKGGRGPTLRDRIEMLNGPLRERANYQANDLLFSQDGRYLATIAPLCVFVYSLETRQLLDYRYAITPEVGSSEFLRTISAAAGEPFATALHHRMMRFYGEHPQDLRIWDMSVVKPVTQSLEVNAMPTLTGFSRDSALLYTVAGNSVRLWETESGKARTRAMPLDADVTHVAFDAKGRRLLTATKGGRVALYDTQYGLPLGLPWEVPGAITHAEFSPDGQAVLVSGKDGYVRLFDTPLPDKPAPDWLALLAESMAGAQVDDQGRMTRAPNIAELRHQVQETVQAAVRDPENLYALYGNWLFLPATERAVSPQSRMPLTEYVARALFISQPGDLLRAQEVAPAHEAVRLRLLEPQRWALHAENLLHQGRTDDARDCVNTALCLIPADPRLLALRNSVQAGQ